MEIAVQFFFLSYVLEKMIYVWKSFQRFETYRLLDRKTSAMKFSLIFIFETVVFA